jgi:hypothetical protein
LLLQLMVCKEMYKMTLQQECKEMASKEIEQVDTATVGEQGQQGDARR